MFNTKKNLGPQEKFTSKFIIHNRELAQLVLTPNKEVDEERATVSALSGILFLSTTHISYKQASEKVSVSYCHTMDRSR